MDSLVINGVAIGRSTIKTVIGTPLHTWAKNLHLDPATTNLCHASPLWRCLDLVLIDWLQHTRWKFLSRCFRLDSEHRRKCVLPSQRSSLRTSGELLLGVLFSHLVMGRDWLIIYILFFVSCFGLVVLLFNNTMTSAIPTWWRVVWQLVHTWCDPISTHGVT